MTAGRYPRELIEPLLLETALPESYRIIPGMYGGAPLGTRPADSRFAARNAGYTMLYAAPELSTAFIETVVRDRFVGRRARVLALKEITARSWVRVSGRSGQSMTLVDLRGDGCARIGAPTDVVRARSHSAGRAFGRAVHRAHGDVDGFVYGSRLSGEDAFAIFDRGIDKLQVSDSGALHDHPALPAILRRYAIGLMR